MKKVFTQENLIGFAVALAAGFAAIAITNLLLPDKIKKYLGA
jgi:hypothetical protein